MYVHILYVLFLYIFVLLYAELVGNYKVKKQDTSDKSVNELIEMRKRKSVPFCVDYLLFVT